MSRCVACPVAGPKCRGEHTPILCAHARRGSGPHIRLLRELAATSPDGPAPPPVQSAAVLDGLAAEAALGLDCPDRLEQIEPG